MKAPGPEIRYEQAAPSGLARLLGDLLGQNLARDPGRSRCLIAGVSAVEAPDADVAVTITVTPEGISLSDGVAREATVRIRASSERLLALVAAPLRFGLPDVFHPKGRVVVADLLRGHLRVRGLVRHPRQVARLNELLSVRDDGP